MPPRSSGCFTCRKRKIRCDEGRPGCERCAKHGVACPGYRRERDGIEFEDQTVLTVQRVKDQHVAKTSLTARKPSNSSKSASPARSQSPLVWQAQDTRHAWSVAAFPQVQQFFSPALEQTKIWDAFLDIYMPQSSGMQSLHFSYLQTISQFAPAQPALRDGLNTLALIQIGELHKDEKLVNAAVESYGKALNGMAKVIAKASSVRDDTVLAAASILMVCEFYDRVKTEGSGWFGHVFGIEQLLHARGPDSFDNSLSLQLFYNARHASLAKSYILRTADPYATPAWRAVAARAATQDWSMELFDVVMQVPGQLQKFDRIDTTGPLALEEIEILLAESAVLESGLRSWLERYHESLSGHGLKAYTLVNVNEFATFASLVPDRTMPNAYRFASFWSAYIHSQYWIAMHYLRTNIKIARELRQNLGAATPSDLAGAVTDEELTGYAYDLCRTMPSFAEPTSGSQGHIGLFVPLAVVMMHFRNNQNWKWCLWGLNVRNNIFSKGLRQPDVKEEDLPKPIIHSAVTAGQSTFSLKPPSDDTLSPSSSDQSPQAFDDMNMKFLADDMHDVDLSIDWGQKTPGMAAVAMGGGVSRGFVEGPDGAEAAVKYAWEHWHEKK